MGGETIPPNFTGDENSPDVKVSVWQLTPALGTSFDVMWFKTHCEAVSWVEDHTDEILEKLHDASVDGAGSVELKIERLETIAEEAAEVFGGVT